jgi:hypothetical protein
LGDAARPLDDTALRTKFIDCAMRAASAFRRNSAEALADRIMNLEQEADAARLWAGAGPFI